MPRKAAVLTLKSLGKPKECSPQRGRKSAASVAGCQTAQYVAIPLTHHTEWVRRKVKSHNIKHYAQITVSVNLKTLCFLENISRTQPSIFRYLRKKSHQNCILCNKQKHLLVPSHARNTIWGLNSFFTNSYKSTQSSSSTWQRATASSHYLELCTAL